MPGSSQDLVVGLDETAVEGLRRMILASGVRQLAVGDLRADEVAGLTWSGNPAHLRSVAAALDRAARGLEDYLVVRAPAGEPVAKMRIDYASEDDTGVFSQLATMDGLQGLGIARMLIEAAERRVRARGLACAALGVEDDNPRARRLYERLGYQASGRRPASWEYEDDAASSDCTKPRSRCCTSACDSRALAAAGVVVRAMYRCAERQMGYGDQRACRGKGAAVMGGWHAYQCW